MKSRVLSFFAQGIGQFIILFYFIYLYVGWFIVLLIIIIIISLFHSVRLWRGLEEEKSPVAIDSARNAVLQRRVFKSWREVYAMSALFVVSGTAFRPVSLVWVLWTRI